MKRKVKLKKFFKVNLWFIILFSISPFLFFIFIIILLEDLFFGNIASKANSKATIKTNPFRSNRLSIVIPHYSNTALLNKCLDSIYKNNEFSIKEDEIIVVDDGTVNSNSEFIKRKYPAVKLLKNKKNRGFIYSSNRGIKEAENEIVLLLNNDVIVEKECLQLLLRHFKHEEVFAVSPKLYGWDKRTFKRGMEIGDFKKGYFRFWNEKDTKFKDMIYRTSPTLFTMGAAMMFRKSYFGQLGGFDKIYRPHWWEDIDICYRAWKRGLKVLYEPESVLYHKGGASIGRYRGSLAVRNEFIFILKNFIDRKIFCSFFRYLPNIIYNGGTEFLVGFLRAIRFFPFILFRRFQEKKYAKKSDSQVLRETCIYYENFKKRNFFYQEPDKKTLLLLSPFFPYPPRHGMQVKVWNTITSLSGNFNIILLTFYRERSQLKYLSKVQNFCKKVEPVKYKLDKMNFFKNLLYPNSVMKWYYNVNFSNKLVDILNTFPIDSVLFESSFLIQYIDYLKRVPSVLVEHDSSILSFKDSYVSAGDNLLLKIIHWYKRKKYLLKKYNEFDKIIVFTSYDKNRIINLNRNLDISIIHPGIKVEKYLPPKEIEKDIDLLFIGSFFHPPNIEGLKYFLNKVYQLIKSKIPHFKFKIIGSNPTNKNVDFLKAWDKKEKNIEFVGEVEDIRDYLYKANVFIAPVRKGGGVKIKILEAMAAGVPVVSTSYALKGINIKVGEEILIGDTPVEMSSKVIRLLRDKKLANKIGRNGKEFVKSNFDIESKSNMINIPL